MPGTLLDWNKLIDILFEIPDQLVNNASWSIKSEN